MKPDTPSGGQSQGPSTDAANNPVVDPSKNVLDLVDAAIKRQDDLREKDSNHLREIMQLRAEWEAERARLESSRIDAIRAVDLEATQRAAEALSVQARSTAGDIADLRKAQYETQGQKAQVVESRLNLGAVVGVFGGLVGLIGLVTAFIVATR